MDRDLASLPAVDHFLYKTAVNLLIQLILKRMRCIQPEKQERHPEMTMKSNSTAPKKPRMDCVKTRFAMREKRGIFYGN